MLKGECNQCSLCCFVGNARCANLIITGKPGEPMASKCAVYDKRVAPNMPILLIHPGGRVEWGTCWHGHPMEDKVIEPWLGRGCSLERED